MTAAVKDWHTKEANRNSDRSAGREIEEDRAR
jgi:hypothetical protein